MKFTMVNSDDFIKRIEAILEYYALSASLFADKLGVQRSGLSHLLSGRNKPSLDFVMKITENFPEVDLYWLLNGTGSFPRKDDEKTAVIKPREVESIPSPAPAINEPVIADLFSQAEEPAPVVSKKSEETLTAKKPERIVIFYSDGTFKEYTPEN